MHSGPSPRTLIPAMVLPAVILVLLSTLATAVAQQDAAQKRFAPLDIRIIPDAAQHGLALMREGQFTVADDVWTLAVALDLGSFRVAVKRIQDNAALMDALSRNFTRLAQPGAGASNATVEFSEAIAALLESEVTSIREGLAAASRNLQSLELATASGD